MATARPDDNAMPASTVAWADLIEYVGPASLLVLIEMRMSAALQRRLQPEDVLQESLLQAWRDREQCRWQGIKSFRSWLLTIIDHRIRDAADHEQAFKRGGTNPPRSLAGPGAPSDGESAADFAPVGSTTPSRVAMYKEQAAAIRETLESLPTELRDVVRMRLLEQRPTEEIAVILGLGVSAIRHRFRKGAELYRRRLAVVLSTRIRSISPENSAPPPGDSASLD